MYGNFNYLTNCLNLNFNRRTSKSRIIQTQAVVNTVDMPEIIVPSLNYRVVDQTKFTDLMVSLVIDSLEGDKMCVPDIYFKCFKDNESAVKLLMSSSKTDTTIQELMALGCPFYPAVVGCTLTGAEINKLDFVIIEDDEVITSIEKVAGFLLSVVFILTLCGTLTFDKNGGENKDQFYIPQFLSGKKNMDDFHDNVDKVLSCDKEKFSMEILTKFPYGILPADYRNRLQLGICGYRIMTAFSLCEFIDNTPPQVFTLKNKIDEIVKNPVSLSVHTKFRSQEFNQKYKSLNKSLETIMYTYGSEFGKKNVQSNNTLYNELSSRGAISFLDNLDVNDFSKNFIDFTVKDASDVSYDDELKEIARES